MQRVREVVKACDADGNGAVSAQEYVDAAARNLVPTSWFGGAVATVSRRFTLKGAARVEIPRRASS